LHRFIANGFSVGFIPRRLWGNDNSAGTFGTALTATISLLLWRTP